MIRYFRKVFVDMNRKKKKWSDLFTNLFYYKAVWIVVGFLTVFPFVRIHIEGYIKITLVWGAICFFVIFVKKEFEFRRIDNILLFLFCLSYGITILSNREGHFFEEVSLLAYTVVFLFLFTRCDRNKTREQICKEILSLFKIVVILTFIYSCIMLVIFLFSIQGELKIGDTATYPYGIWEGRLWGFCNPNNGGTLNYISIIFSFLIFLWDKKKCKFLISNIILQFCCFSLTQSRGAMLALCTFVAGYIFFLKKNIYSYSGKKGIAYKILVVLISVVLLYDIYDFTLSALERVRNIPYHILSMTEGNSIDEMEGREEELKRKVDRSNVAGETSGRTELWKIGIKTYLRKPVFGIGHRSIDDVLNKELSLEQYKNSAGGELHNIYITILVSSGCIGAILIFTFWGLLLWRCLRYLCSKNTDLFGKHLMLLLPTWFVGDLVESRIMLSTCFLSILFWIVTGYILYYLRIEEENTRN